jgi:hypothetical protein
MKVSRFEHAVLQWLRDHADPQLAVLLSSCRVVGREHTGVGLYLDLESPPVESRASVESPVSGPDFQSPEIPHGGGSLLFLTDGRPTLLEIYTYEATFPEHGLEEFTLQESPDARLSSPARGLGG